MNDQDLSDTLNFEVLDYPSAWAIQKDRGAELTHLGNCSSVPGWCKISGPGLLCDCGAVEREWERLKGLSESIEKTQFVLDAEVGASHTEVDHWLDDGKVRDLVRLKSLQFVKKFYKLLIS